MRRLKYTLLESFSKKNTLKIAGCHNPLGAKIAEETGFDAVWFSGFEFATSMCLPDASILTMSEHLTAISSIARAINIPLLADCDSGFGDANNVAFMVKEYEHAGVSGICIEDKLFPKLNSFCSEKQNLLEIDEFCLKLISAVEARRSKHFTIVARIESFIAGTGVDDAVKRANAYARAGADALVIHSKAPDTHELKHFFDKARILPIPFIVIPTTYYKTTLDELGLISSNIKGVIYANQGIRASIKALKNTFQEILSNNSSASIENELASIQEAFRYQNMPNHTKNYEHLKSCLNDLHSISKVS